jgi:hypothetical protein
MNNEPVAWMHQNPDYAISKHQSLEYNIPLYTHQYERPHNTVLVPCDKLAEMQAEIKALKAHLVKELTEILATIKCLSDEVSPYKEYENTYSDGWLDACNTVYDEVFAILRKAQE